MTLIFLIVDSWKYMSRMTFFSYKNESILKILSLQIPDGLDLFFWLLALLTLVVKMFTSYRKLQKKKISLLNTSAKKVRKFWQFF